MIIDFFAFHYFLIYVSKHLFNFHNQSNIYVIIANDSFAIYRGSLLLNMRLAWILFFSDLHFAFFILAILHDGHTSPLIPSMALLSIIRGLAQSLPSLDRLWAVPGVSQQTRPGSLCSPGRLEPPCSYSHYRLAVLNPYHLGIAV